MEQDIYTLQQEQSVQKIKDNHKTKENMYLFQGCFTNGWPHCIMASIITVSEYIETLINQKVGNIVTTK